MATTTDQTVTTRSTDVAGATITVLDHPAADAGHRGVTLLLHGGGGLATVAGFGALLAERTGERVIVPTHPGFGGTPRGALETPADLAAVYHELLEVLDLTDVTVVGNSFGGWLAAEMALLPSSRVRRAVLVDPVGVVVDGLRPADVRGMSLREIQALSWHDPSRAAAAAGDGSSPSPDVQALVSYAGPAMSDPTLGDRLAAATMPVHVLWGASDRIVSPEYGRAFAARVPGATFTVLPEVGHLPQLEAPEQLLEALAALG